MLNRKQTVFVIEFQDMESRNNQIFDLWIMIPNGHGLGLEYISGITITIN